MKKKLTEIEKTIQKTPLYEVNYSYQNSISYSQFSTFQQCPHQWYLTYVKKLTPFRSSIHTVFGDAIHETLQQYLDVMYNTSGAASDNLNLQEIFQEKFINLYNIEYEKIKTHFSNAEEMREFFDDGIEILKYIQKNRRKIFTIRKVRLIGIELPIVQQVKNNLFYKGYIDLVLYDEDLDKVTIIDFKTSKNGWRKDREKKDENKTAQVVFYKEYFSKQYNWDVDKINVEFFIVKRKIYENSEFPISRIQRFSPPSGKNTRNKVMNKFENFLNEAFDEKFGKPIEKIYLKNPSEHNCRFCPYNEDNINCNKLN